METARDIAAIIRQEARLVFPRFGEDEAFALGGRLREMALARSAGVVIDIRLWDCRLFFAATAGAVPDNADWARRKINTVRRRRRSSYRLVLEHAAADRLFPPGANMPPADYALAGGGFPVSVAGAGVVGALAVSGLPEREDHGLAVQAICGVLALDYSELALAPSAEG